MSCLHGDDLRSNPGKNADTPPGSKMPSHTEAEREQCASARQLPLGGHLSWPGLLALHRGAHAEAAWSTGAGNI